MENQAAQREHKPMEENVTLMKKSLGMTIAIIVLAILIGNFITAKYSTAGETGRDSRFIAYDNGTVLDTKTNLMWAAKDNGSHVNWAEAKSYCENYRGGGYTDWRMPTQAELAGLYDGAKGYKPSYPDGVITGPVSEGFQLLVHLTEFIRLSSGFVWSSDTTGSMVSCLCFDNGRSYWFHPNPHYALPVRFSK
jgi:hypothetical protein